MGAKTLPLRSDVTHEETWNLESIFPDIKSWEKAYKVVEKRISEMAPGGGFIFNQVHNIQPQVPPENVLRMFDTAFQYGTYPISV